MSRLSKASRRLPGAEVRSLGMTVKFSPSEYAEVEAVAERAGMAVSAWVAMTATGLEPSAAWLLRVAERVDAAIEHVRCRM